MMTQYLRDLSTFDKNDVDEFLASFDTVLTDCDGVIWLYEKALEGSVDVINRLRMLGKKVFLVSNNCTLTIDGYIKKAKSFGLDVEHDDIIIPSLVAKSYLKEHNLKKKAFILASSTFKEELETSGFICSNDVGPNHELDLNDLKNELMNLDKDVGAVAIDFDQNINYIKMMKALIHLRMNKDCLFVVGATDFQVPVQDNFSIIGPGSFIKTLEVLSGRKAVVTGKPSPLLKDFISKRHPIDPERTIMIGDMIALDMQFGTNCGFQKLLVLSGIAKLEDAKEDSTNLPHYYIKTLGDLLPLLPNP